VVAATEGSEIDETEIMNASGMASKSVIREFIQACVNHDKEVALKAFHEALRSRIDAKLFLEQVLHMMRMGLLLKISKQSLDYVSSHISKEDIAFLNKLIVEHAAEFNSKLFAGILDAYALIQHSPIPELGVEIAISNI
jgi:DNA polymerase III gamma/tau subunit